MIVFPQPRTKSDHSVEQALQSRRTVRDFDARAAIGQADLGQLLWAAQGITGDEGRRTAPSAGMTYPLVLYVVVERVTGLASGVYRYDPRQHALAVVAKGSVIDKLEKIVSRDGVVANAAVAIIFASSYESTVAKYEERGVIYAHYEVGHASQNVYLQAQSLGLGTVAMGAFAEDAVFALAHLPEDEVALYVMPVGKPESANPCQII